MKMDGAPVWTAAEWLEFFQQTKEHLNKEAKGTKRRAREIAVIDEYITRITKYRLNEPIAFVYGGYHKDYIAPAAKLVLMEMLTCRVGFLRSFNDMTLVSS